MDLSNKLVIQIIEYVKYAASIFPFSQIILIRANFGYIDLINELEILFFCKLI